MSIYGTGSERVESFYRERLMGALCALSCCESVYNKCCIYYALLNHEFDLILFYAICINDIIFAVFCTGTASALVI